MSALFASGRVIDLILGLMLLEGAVLIIVRKRTGGGVPTPQLVITLLSGAALMLAVRAALVGANWSVIACFLLASLVIHVVDLGTRWGGRRQAADATPVVRR